MQSHLYPLPSSPQGKPFKIGFRCQRLHKTTLSPSASPFPPSPEIPQASFLPLIWVFTFGAPCRPFFCLTERSIRLGPISCNICPCSVPAQWLEFHWTLVEWTEHQFSASVFHSVKQGSYINVYTNSCFWFPKFRLSINHLPSIWSCVFLMSVTWKTQLWLW
jgi:hypothetical protein